MINVSKIAEDTSNNNLRVFLDYLSDNFGQMTISRLSANDLNDIKMLLFSIAHQAASETAHQYVIEISNQSEQATLNMMRAMLAGSFLERKEHSGVEISEDEIKLLSDKA
jgi:hypothetical protein